MTRVLLIALIALSLPATLNAQTVDTAPRTFIINRTNDGFEPNYLKIIQGDVVTFVNKSDADIWPASNFHPTHTLYSEFDPLKGFGPGQSWSFTFQKAGIWRMHDHLSPHVTGAIEVTASGGATSSVDATQPATPGFFARVWSSFIQWWHTLFNGPSKRTANPTTAIDQKLLADFKSQNEQGKYSWLENIAKEKSPETAWTYVKAAYNTPEGVVGNPHDLAHLVGQLLFKSYGFAGLSTCEPIFAFGCYHGLMEVAFDKDHPESYIDNLMRGQAGCKIVGDVTSPSYWSCIHGMGHGIATFREHDLDTSLKDCDRLDAAVHTYCHDGVFMEFSISAAPSFYKRDNPVYPCDIVGEDYKIACARSQTQVMRLRFQMKTPEIAQACLNTRNDKIVYHCIDSIGYFVGQTNGTNPSNIVSKCREIQDDAGAAQCMAAAAGELVFEDSAGWQDASKKICDSLSGQYKDRCLARVEQVKQSYGRE